MHVEEPHEEDEGILVKALLLSLLGLLVQEPASVRPDLRGCLRRDAQVLALL